jgi:exosortase/archaeosortase family protein
VRGSDFGRFVLRFGLLLGALNLLLLLPWSRSHFVYPWTSLNASWAVRLASLTGGEYSATGTQVLAGYQVMDVKVGCNGVEALALCASAILAFPASWTRKALGLMMAMVGVFGLNLIRLANLFFIALHFPAQYELFHIYIWQTLIAIMSFGIFLVWGRFLASSPTQLPSPTSS